MSIRTRVRPAIVKVAESASGLAYRHNWLQPRVVVAPGPAPFPGFGEMLHQLRSLELARMPRTDGLLLSAGASGSWYFRWIAEWYRPTARQIGIELYMPKPDDLPDDVEWIVNSVGEMTGVDDGSVGLIFSGQNFEHLFQDDAVEFLRECHRVLRPGGSLVMDSPNRTVTALLGWSQPEHTIEFTPDEAVELVTVAGFDVTSVRGLWLCREGEGGETLPLWDAPDAPELMRRALLARDRPDDSFVWWLEATRADREPDVETLRRRHREIFAQAWPERQQRLRSEAGTRHEIDGEVVVSVPVGQTGAAMTGPDMPWAPGHYVATVRVRRAASGSGSRSAELAGAGAEVATVDASSGDGTILVSRSLTAADLPSGEWASIRLEFDVAELVWGGHVRVVSTGLAALEVRLALQLDESGTRVAPTPAA